MTSLPGVTFQAAAEMWERCVGAPAITETGELRLQLSGGVRLDIVPGAPEGED